MTRTGRLFSDLAVGDTASITRVVTPDDFVIFAHVSGNLNPANLPGADGAGAAPSMWLGSLFSAVLGNVLPGPGTVYTAQSLRFHARALVGDTLTVSVTVQALRPPATVVLQTRIERAGTLIADGVAEVLAPATRQALDAAALPELTVLRHRNVAHLMAACA